MPLKSRNKPVTLTVTLAERSRILRHRSRITQAELGTMLGVSRRTIVSMEDGHKPRAKTIELFQILERRNGRGSLSP